MPNTVNDKLISENTTPDIKYGVYKIVIYL